MAEFPNARTDWRAVTGTRVRVGAHPASAMAGWKFHASVGHLGSRGVRVELPPPRGSQPRIDPTRSFLGQPEETSKEPVAATRIVVTGRDRKRFTEYLTEDKKATLADLFAIAHTTIKNGAIYCVFDGLDLESDQIVWKVRHVIDVATILNR